MSIDLYRVMTYIKELNELFNAPKVQIVVMFGALLIYANVADNFIRKLRDWLTEMRAKRSQMK